MTDFAFQDVGRDFLAGRTRALLADDPGLGKTIQTIKAAAKARVRELLVVCPKSGVGMWPAKFREFWPKDQAPPRVHVLNYDRFSRDKTDADLAVAARWDLLVLDEAHWLRSPDAERTQIIYKKLVTRARRNWLLTGTPMPNHAGELWTMLRTFRPDLLRAAHAVSQEAFEDAFCEIENHATRGRIIRGSKGLGVLRAMLTEGGFMLRRKKEEVLRELPPLIFDDYPVDGSELAWGPSPPLAALGLAPDAGTDDILTILRSSEIALATERRLTGLLKAPLVADLVATELEGGVKKIIVFAYHREVLDALQRDLARFGVARLDGATSSRAREDLVWAFQRGEHTRVFLGQIDACREVLTLTAADRVIFAEASWTPSFNHQAACRAHRIGTVTPVRASFVTLLGSIDEMIGRALARKAAEIDLVFN